MQRLYYLINKVKNLLTFSKKSNIVIISEGELAVSRKSKFALPDQEAVEQVEEVKETKKEANYDSFALSLVQDKTSNQFVLVSIELDSTTMQAGQVKVLETSSSRNELVTRFKIKALEILD